MNMIKRAAVIILSVLVILSAFTACGGKSPDELIIGSWRDSTGTTGYEFNEDVCLIAEIVAGVVFRAENGCFGLDVFV